MPVSSLFSSGQDAHSTAIHYLTDRTPLIQLLHLDSLLPTNCLKRD
ncbi:MAG: hypothetical protein F6K53_38115 [Moorea sp. SIO4A1]|nr:hypothetical protein [Moorena sp. SIO4A1]NEQ62873.1 hypothetical protein [Moorena sp. SIO4A1]